MKRIKIALCCLLFLLPGLTLHAADTASSADDYRQLELFTDVLALIENSYVEATDQRELIYGAVRGMLETLDPHSSFLTPDMYEDMQADTHGEFGGLGIEIAIKHKALIVVAPIEDTPAFQAGIKAGDRIISIDGEVTEEMGIMDAVRLLRGAKGEEVTLRIERDGLDTPLDIVVVRDLIQLKSVKSRVIDQRIGYARISQFQERTSNDLRQQLNNLQKDGHPLTALILDLRNNPGGLLDQAVAVADLFLNEGLIVYTEGRDSDAVLQFSATTMTTQPDYPIIVLINGGSASASEIVAGALQDHRRALILGQQSFGKGSVQTIVPLGDDAGLRLTTARYFTPQGRSIQARGITPDIVVAVKPPETPEKKTNIREADLDNHFAAQPLGSEQTDVISSSDNFTNDYQLQRALDMLKGYDIMRKAQP